MSSRSYLLLLALVACGDQDPNRRFIMDGGPTTDTLGDTPPALQPVTVTVLNGLTGASGIQTYFQNADSSLVASPLTDASGSAGAVMAAGGYVTVLAPFLTFGGSGPFYELETWADVKPGDHLVLGGGSGGTSASVTFHLPIDGSDNVTTYHVNTTCGNASGPAPQSGAFVSVGFNTSCSTVDVLVYGTDVNGVPVSSFAMTGQAITDASTIDYTAQTYTDAAARSYTFTNNPNSTAQIFGNDDFLTARGSLFGSSFNPTQTATATATGTMPVLPTGALDVVYARQTIPRTSRNFYEWGTTGTYSTDWGAHLLPDLDTNPVGFDPGTQVAGWSTTGGAVTADFNGVAMFTYRQATDTTWYWLMFGPSDHAHAFPTLPTDVADFKIQASDNFGVDYIVTVKSPGGWDAARANIFNAPPVPTGTAGSVMYDEYSTSVNLTASHRTVAKRASGPRWFNPRR